MHIVLQCVYFVYCIGSWAEQSRSLANNGWYLLLTGSPLCAVRGLWQRPAGLSAMSVLSDNHSPQSVSLWRATALPPPCHSFICGSRLYCLQSVYAIFICLNAAFLPIVWLYIAGNGNGLKPGLSQVYGGLQPPDTSTHKVGMQMGRNQLYFTSRA